MFKLPKNIRIDELFEVLAKHHKELSNRYGEIHVGIEELIYAKSCKIILVTTGRLSSDEPEETVTFISQK